MNYPPPHYPPNFHHQSSYSQFLTTRKVSRYLPRHGNIQEEEIKCHLLNPWPSHRSLPGGFTSGRPRVLLVLDGGGDADTVKREARKNGPRQVQARELRTVRRWRWPPALSCCSLATVSPWHHGAIILAGACSNNFSSPDH